MPFNIFKRAEQPAATAAAGRDEAAVSTAEGIEFEAYSEDWQLTGRITASGRLSDVLNRREPISIAGMRWAPLDGSEPYTDAPGLQQVDPYDLIVVLTGPESLPELDAQHRAALRVHKVTYDVLLNLGPVRVFGTIYLHPGSEPQQLLDRYTELFVPVTRAVAFQGDRRLTRDVKDVVLVNRSYLRGLEQVERVADDEFLRPGAERATDDAPADAGGDEDPSESRAGGPGAAEAASSAEGTPEA